MTNPNLESAIEKLKDNVTWNKSISSIRSSRSVRFTELEEEAILEALNPKPVDVEKLRTEFKERFTARIDNVYVINKLPREVFDWFLANIPQNQAVEKPSDNLKQEE